MALIGAYLSTGYPAIEHAAPPQILWQVVYGGPLHYELTIPLP